MRTVYNLTCAVPVSQHFLLIKIQKSFFYLYIVFIWER
nr:MAG TPA: hypothetical protein [Caudoviricetes sp.]